MPNEAHERAPCYEVPARSVSGEYASSCTGQARRNPSLPIRYATTAWPLHRQQVMDEPNDRCQDDSDVTHLRERHLPLLLLSHGVLSGTRTFPVLGAQRLSSAPRAMTRRARGGRATPLRGATIPCPALVGMSNGR